MTVTGIPEDAGMYQFLCFLFILALPGVMDGVYCYAYICPWLFDSMFASYTPYVWSVFCWILFDSGVDGGFWTRFISFISFLLEHLSYVLLSTAMFNFIHEMMPFIDELRVGSRDVIASGKPSNRQPGPSEGHSINRPANPVYKLATPVIRSNVSHFVQAVSLVGTQPPKPPSKGDPPIFSLSII